MTPHAAEPAFAAASDHRPTAIDCDLHAKAGIIGALLDALNGSGTYRLVDRAGELFLEPR